MLPVPLSGEQMPAGAQLQSAFGTSNCAGFKVSSTSRPSVSVPPAGLLTKIV
jgi:hypothetical protein